MILARIDNEVVTAKQFFAHLKLTGKFEELMIGFIQHKIAVLEAKKRKIQISQQDIQHAADDFRRAEGLNRAKDTYEWLEHLGLTPEEFEQFISEKSYASKIMNIVVSDKKITEYFRLNYQKFEKVAIKHIVVEGADKSKELATVLDDDPELFDEFVREYSLDQDSKEKGGYLGEIRRGMMPEEIESKVFNAQHAGMIFGPFRLDDSDIYEIIMVVEKKPAQLDENAKTMIFGIIYDEWLQNCSKSYPIELGLDVLGN